MHCCTGAHADAFRTGCAISRRTRATAAGRRLAARASSASAASTTA